MVLVIYAFQRYSKFYSKFVLEIFAFTAANYSLTEIFYKLLKLLNGC